MRTSLRRWLLHRREPKMKPLCTRTSWGDFAYRMRRAIEIDMAIELGETTRAELQAMQKTRLLPAVSPDAVTVADVRYWWYADETIKVAAGIDQYATQPMNLIEV